MSTVKAIRAGLATFLARFAIRCENAITGWADREATRAGQTDRHD